MTFSVINSAINNRLQMVYRVVNSKNALPILDNIIFKVEGDILSLMASDSENTLITQVTIAESDGDGSFAVNARNITDAIKNLASEAEMTFDVNIEANTMKVRYPSGVFSLPIENADEFPVSPSLSEESKVEFGIADKMLGDNIARTIGATAQDELRPVMNGIYFDLTPDCLAIVASDGHQLVRSRVLKLKSEAPASFIMPKKPATLLKGILGKSGEEVRIAFDGRNMVVTAENFTLVSRLIEGRYPNYNSVIPQNNPNILTVNRLDILAALKRIVPFANDHSCLVRMHVETDTLQLDTEDYDFSKTATEKMNADYNGTSMSIGFKGSTMIEVLQNIECGEVVAQLADPSRAGVFLPSEQPEGQEILMLLMPMLLND